MSPCHQPDIWVCLSAASLRLSHSSRNKIESKERRLNTWWMAVWCLSRHCVCLPPILAAAIPALLFLSVWACIVFPQTQGHQVLVWQIERNANTVSREHRNALIEPRGAGSRKVTVSKRSRGDFIFCLWTNIVTWHFQESSVLASTSFFSL